MLAEPQIRELQAFLQPMETLNLLAVVDELVAELRQRRQEREDGYVALARAILSEEPLEVRELEQAA